MRSLFTIGTKAIRSLIRELSPTQATDTTRGLVFAGAVGVIAGLGAVVFRALIQAIEQFFFGNGAEILSFLGPYYIVAIPAIGGLIVGPMIYLFAREAKGHGVPEVMISVIKEGGRIRPVVALVKILASAFCIGTGGSVGREGPIVQIGATFGSSLGQRLKLPEEWIRNLVACGAAGGISATFNAPIAGVFFALEVILGRFTTRYFSVVVCSSVVAAVVSHAFFPNVANLKVDPYELRNAMELPLYAILGLLAAVVGVGFIIVLYRFESLFERLSFPEYLKPALGGIAIGILGLYTVNLQNGGGILERPLLGVGYPGVEAAALGEILVVDALILMALKILATSLTIGSGGSGGVFAPSLFIGAMLGTAFGTVAHQVFPSFTAPAGAYALVGMAAVFSAAARAPITAVIILFELTGDYKIILPLMLGVVISTVIAQSLYRESIYTKKVHRAGVSLPTEDSENIMRRVSVGDVMTTDFPTVPASMRVADLWKRFETSDHRGFPVVNDAGELEGVVTVGDVEKAYRYNKQSAPIGTVATRSVVVAYPDQSIHDALLALGAQEVGRIPVVSRDNPRKLIGVLRRHDIIRAYTQNADEGNLPTTLQDG